MYFKRLELVGFKSFMDKTVLNFEPGVTAVVGPNGCGKSNIFDSIRWVLGEQSVKSLRGSQMEDVIFNGTDSKPALGMAEVSLTFDNSHKHFSVEHDEVMITRRIFRSGESEYLLNKATCRLKDITEMLLGTGIGAESYSIVAQGKIDLILSSRPEDRRAVFDEASGITKYKAQKREALRRLEDTDQNLLRVNDIITEVKRSIGYLERQANKARRYQVAFEELKAKELCLAKMQAAQIRKEKDAVEEQLSRLALDETALQIKIKEQESTITQRNLELKAVEDNVAASKAGLVDAQNSIQRNTQHVTINSEHIKELEGTQQYLQTQINQAKELLAQDDAKLAALVTEQRQLKSALEAKVTALKTHEETLTAIVSAMKASQDAIQSSKNRILELATKSSSAKNELTDATAKQHVHDARTKRLQLEKAKIGEERAQVEATINALSSELLELERQFETLRQETATRQAEFDAATREGAEISAELDSLEKQRLALLSQKEFLERLKSQYEDITESMNARIYLDTLPNEKISGLVIRLRDVPLPADLPGAEGKTGFTMSGEAKPVDLDAQKVNERLRQVEESIAGLTARKTDSEAAISRLKAILQELGQREQEQQLALGNKRAVHQSITDQYTKVKEEEQIIMREFSDVGSEMTKLAQQLSGLQQQLSELERENHACEESIHAEQERISLGLRTKEETLVAIAKVKTEIENFCKRINAEDSELTALEDSCSRSRESLANHQRKIDETIERVDALRKEIRALEEHTGAIRGAITQQQEDLSREEKRCADLARAVEESYKGIDERRKALESIREQSYVQQMNQKDLTYKYQTLKERLLSAYKIDLDTIIAARPFHLPDPSILLLQYSGILKPEEVFPSFVQFDEPILEEAIARLKEKIDGYGTVNLVAIDEYEELKKRYDFLTQQHDDLQTAKQSLQDAIQKINRTTRKMFIETFTMVAAEFRTYFKMLFNGGDAQVYLIDEHDPLESGIEIICRPPGKKLQNVLLLSGGEKSMAAIALIFAIFKVKPAPFCILDEIDAALDESNVERFSRLFQEFTGTSQFIVITHNKRTIANANVMYGITMQESGVSKIVSVKFGENKSREVAEKEPEPVAA